MKLRLSVGFHWFPVCGFPMQLPAAVFGVSKSAAVVTPWSSSLLWLMTIKREISIAKAARAEPSFGIDGTWFPIITFFPLSSRLTSKRTSLIEGRGLKPRILSHFIQIFVNNRNIFFLINLSLCCLLLDFFFGSFDFEVFWVRVVFS